MSHRRKRSASRVDAGSLVGGALLGVLFAWGLHSAWRRWRKPATAPAVIYLPRAGGEVSPAPPVPAVAPVHIHLEYPEEPRRALPDVVAAVVRASLAGAPKRQRAAPRAVQTGIAVRDGRLRLTDWSAWQEFGSRAVDRALDSGAEDSEEILACVMRAALPGWPWPPNAGTPMAAQWMKLAPAFAEALGLPPPPPRRGHLRIIK